MNIGRLKYKITILQPIKVRSTSGAQVDTWQVYSNTRADVEYNSGTKGENSGEIFSSQSIKIKVRYIEGLNETMRIQMENRLYKIVFINPLVFRRVQQVTIELVND